MNRVSVGLLLAVCGTAALPSTLANNCTVPAEVAVQTSNIAFTYLPLTSRAGTPPARAASIIGTNSGRALDVSKAAARSQLAIHLTFAATQVPVFSQGSATCTVDSTTGIDIRKVDRDPAIEAPNNLPTNVQVLYSARIAARVLRI